MWGALYTEFQGGEIGTGVAIGDLDCDGMLDIYVVNKNRPNQLFRQAAPFRFEDISASAGAPGGPTWSTGVTLADVNNDGALDIYACQFAGPNLLYINDGRGRFTEGAAAAGIDMVSGSVIGAFEDYDRDGDLDLFVATNIMDANNHPEGEVSRLFRNRGDGTFEDVSAIAGISGERARSHAAIWFDYNGDGWTDLYVSNDFSEPDFFYRNNGDGTFTNMLAEAVAHTPWFSMGADYADINNDGLFDFFVADMAGTTHYKSKVTMGDMGGIVNDMDALETPQYMKNAVYLNSGTDRSLEVAKITGLGSSDWTWSPRFEDLDNDGWVDLHITNGMVRSFINSDLVNRTKLAQSQQEVIAMVRNSPRLDEANITLRNMGDLKFKKVHADWGLDHVGVSFGSALADLDRDGDMDLVYANLDDTVSLYRNDAPGGNSISISLKGTASNSHGIGARVFVKSSHGMQARANTVSRGSLSSSPAVMHFGLGVDERADSVRIEWPSGHVQELGSLPANAHYAVTEPPGRPEPPAVIHGRPASSGIFADEAEQRGLDRFNVERVFDDTLRQSLLPNRMNTLGGGVAWCDVDGDDRADIFFTGSAGHPGALYIAGGNGGYSRSPYPQPWDTASDVEGMSPVFLDVNGDGAPDLLVSSGSTESDAGSDNYRARLYLNDGRGAFKEVPAAGFPIEPFSASIATAGDFDRDGDLDVFIGGRVVPGEYPVAPRSALLENRDGRLIDVTERVMPPLRDIGMVTGALWTDVDRDGWSDLLVVGEWMSPRLFRNDGGAGFTETTASAGLAELTGWWNSVESADVNNDGYIDYVLGNVGLNTKYHASPGHPAKIYFADIEGTGTCEIIEAKFEGDRFYPVRGRSCSSRAMPSLKEKFPTFHAFGSALLTEVYSPEKLEKSLELEANELASGVLVNDGSGRFEFRPFPRSAQTSPIFGISARDFDGDGNVDIVGVQNFAGPQVETGHFDGGIGIMLKGDGLGGFRALTAQESGIVLPGDSRGVASGDANLDGWPDLVVARINGRASLLAGKPCENGHSFGVHLSDAGGNPAGIGARLTLRYKDGSRQAAELCSGSGYQSQSEPVAFFGYKEGNEPVEIEVRWPDGGVSTHSVSLGIPLVTLSR